MVEQLVRIVSFVGSALARSWWLLLISAFPLLVRRPSRARLEELLGPLLHERDIPVPEVGGGGSNPT